MERPWVFCTGFPYNTCAVEEKPALLRGQNETENRVCIIQDVEDKLFLAAMGANAFRGFICGHRTAAFVITLLREKTAAETIVAIMLARYDADRDTVTSCRAEYPGCCGRCQRHR